uniref:phosphatidylinositol-3,4,5-trisphosphate 5-phosphatase n=1 Tax=Scleropages formosus TaxID=113540 RepID=A0A8D0CKL5_SCLFO
CVCVCGMGGLQGLSVWYHRDISRVQAEDLLARAGRDGSFLVRDSESVPGAYALCLLFQRHVHTYRILPDMEGLLAVQTSQGVQVNCFRTLADLVVGYQQPHKGLVAPLLYPVGQESEQADESSGEGAGPLRGGAQQDRTPKSARQLISEIDLTLSSLETLAKVFDHPTCPLAGSRAQVGVMPASLRCRMSPCTVPDLLHQRALGLRFYTGRESRVPHGPVQHEQGSERLPKCEAFCHLLQLMRTRQSRQGEPDLISVFVGTWNMGSSPPPRSLQSWLLCRGLGVVPDESTATLPHDIYAFGTQENTQGDREWAEQLRAALRSVTHIDFKLVVLQSLWNMRLAVFVRPEHEKRISHISSASVKTGLGNTLGNKGAVGASFLFNGTSLGFVNCHLTSGTEKAARRNQNFQDILRLLSLGDRQLSAFDISLRFTHVFWCGDLNYRLDLDVQDILKHILKREFEALMCADQLTRERHKRKVFLHFNEEKILFPPTYRYERGSRECYLWQKYKTSGVRINVPSWCDRVLWKSYPETHIACTAYGCTDDITTSDHSPVFATFQVGVASPFLSKTGLSPSSDCLVAWIELESIEVILKTASKAKFFIEFHSYCLEEFRRSGDNDSQSCEVPGFLKLGWSPRQLPKLIPIVSDKEYLQDQHLLLSVKSCDSFESYGWLFSTHFCCLSTEPNHAVKSFFINFLFHSDLICLVL